MNEAQEKRVRLSIKHVEVEIAKRYKFQGRQRCGEAVRRRSETFGMTNDKV